MLLIHCMFDLTPSRVCGVCMRGVRETKTGPNNIMLCLKHPNESSIIIIISWFSVTLPLLSQSSLNLESCIQLYHTAVVYLCHSSQLYISLASSITPFSFSLPWLPHLGFKSHLYFSNVIFSFLSHSNSNFEFALRLKYLHFPHRLVLRYLHSTFMKIFEHCSPLTTAFGLNAEAMLEFFMKKFAC